MSALPRLAHAHALVVVLAAAFGLASCARQGHEAGSQPRGVGVLGVSSYRDGESATSLQALLDRCAAPRQAGSSPGEDLGAACDQLRRTMRNQPGNSVPATEPRR